MILFLAEHRTNGPLYEYHSFLSFQQYKPNFQHNAWEYSNPRDELSYLDQLVEDRQIFEYWSHAAAYLPMRDYRFSLPQKRALSSGKQQHWFKPDQENDKEVHEHTTSVTINDLDAESFINECGA